MLRDVKTVLTEDFSDYRYLQIVNSSNVVFACGVRDTTSNTISVKTQMFWCKEYINDFLNWVITKRYVNIWGCNFNSDKAPITTKKLVLLIRSIKNSTVKTGGSRTNVVGYKVKYDEVDAEFRSAISYVSRKLQIAVYTTSEPDTYYIRIPRFIIESPILIGGWLLPFRSLFCLDTTLPLVDGVQKALHNRNHPDRKYAVKIPNGPAIYSIYKYYCSHRKALRTDKKVLIKLPNSFIHDSLGFTKILDRFPKNPIPTDMYEYCVGRFIGKV